MAREYGYVALLFTLFVLPRVIQRYRIPSAVTALAFGLIAGPGTNLITHDDTVTLLSTLGIVSLFLFAGLDVSLPELHRERRVLSEHVLVGAVVLAAVTALIAAASGLAVRAAVLTGLALLTPSTGFILDSLAGWFPGDRDRFWVRSKAIANEIVSLIVLFVVLQSTSVGHLALSAGVLIAMIAVLPFVFRVFAAVVVPYAPKSEFGFLMMVAAACALVTRQLGVYYLVGAFAVGMAARQFRSQLPTLSSDHMLVTVESFASLFVPFYFFHAGASLLRDDFSLAAVGYGALFIVTLLPFRLLLVASHRALRLGEAPSSGLRIAMAMLPTTVFTLVLAEILRANFTTPNGWIGGLIIYACANSLLPGFVLRVEPPAFEDELRLGAAG